MVLIIISVVVTLIIHIEILGEIISGHGGNGFVLRIVIKITSRYGHFFSPLIAVIQSRRVSGGIPVHGCGK